jgi:hypothetical protein
MDMGEIIGDAFKYPVSNWKRLLILGVLVLITQLSVEIVMGYGRVSGLLYFLIIPAIIASLLASGYQLRTLATSIMKEDEPPVFNEWTKMFLDGLRVLIVGLIYEIIPILILMAGFIMIMISRGAMLLGLLVMLLGLVILLIVGIIMVMAVSNMAYHDEIGAALRFGEIKERIKSIGWLKYILVLILLGVIYLILALVASFVSIIPYVGLVLASLIIYPFMYLFMYRAYGLIFRETLEDDELQQEVEELPETEEMNI